MNKSFDTLQKIQTFLQKFALGTLTVEEWTHEAHFVIAFSYLIQHPLEEAQRLLAKEIQRNNTTLGIPNNETRGYHDTLTKFYTRKIHNYLHKYKMTSLKVQYIQQLLNSKVVEKDYPLQFYSPTLLFSKQARKEWVEPDLQRKSNDTDQFQYKT